MFRLLGGIVSVSFQSRNLVVSNTWDTAAETWPWMRKPQTLPPFVGRFTRVSNFGRKCHQMFPTFAARLPRFQHFSMSRPSMRCFSWSLSSVASSSIACWAESMRWSTWQGSERGGFQPSPGRWHCLVGPGIASQYAADQGREFYVLVQKTVGRNWDLFGEL